MAWTLLIIGSVLEVGWAVGLKYTEGFTALVPTAIVAITFVVCFVLVAIAARTIPVGTAYAVFTGIGAGGTGIVAIFLFDEPANAARMLSLVAIVAGVMGLKMFAGEPRKAPDGDGPVEGRP